MTIDPPDILIPPEVIQTYERVKLEHNKTNPRYLDMSAVSVALNATENKISVSNELFGPIPNQTLNIPSEYWNFIDTDYNENTGTSQAMLNAIGAPFTNFNGSELITKVTALGPYNTTIERMTEALIIRRSID